MTTKDVKHTPVTDDGTMPSDEHIVELYWDRDETAIKLTDAKYGRYLYAIAYRILHDDPDCEECLNDTYLGTWNRIPPSRPNPLQAFLSVIMRNTAVDRYRHRMAGRRVPSEMTVSLEELDDCLSYSTAPSEEYDRGDLSRLLDGYLRSLTERQEFAFVCRYYYGDSIENIAAMLQCGVATVYRELKTVRAGLRALLEKEGYEL